jgi:hypothetical protein
MLNAFIFLLTGDSWLVSCLGVLYLSKELFSRVVPPSQPLGSPLITSGDASSSYTGLFRFRLWWTGAWKEVLVDDRLPTVNGRLVFLHSQHSDTYWAALLEKAYAK